MIRTNVLRTAEQPAPISESNLIGRTALAHRLYETFDWTDPGTDDTSDDVGRDITWSEFGDVVAFVSLVLLGAFLAFGSTSGSDTIASVDRPDAAPPSSVVRPVE